MKPLTHFDPAAGTINADAEQLWQATLNLIRNSLDAMPDGGELTVGTWRENGQVRLRVTDTGKGMSEEQLKTGVRALFHHQAQRHRPRAGARPANHQRTRRSRGM